MIHITCNMGNPDLPDTYALSPQACGPRALGIHIRQIPPAHVTTYTCICVCVCVYRCVVCISVVIVTLFQFSYCFC